MPTDLTMQVQPILPVWEVVSLAAALLALLAYGSVLLLRRQVPPRWVAILAGWRVAAVAVFVLILLHPTLAFTTTGDRLPDLAVLVNTSASMGLPGGKGRDSRLEEALADLQTGPLAAALRGRYRVHWFAFDRAARPLSEKALADLKPGRNGARTAASLTSAYNQLRAIDATPARVLLVSDGNDTGQTDPARVAGQLGVVVDALPPAAAPDALPLQIADIQCARRVLLGSETHFRVTLRGTATGGAGQRLQLRLSENGKEVLTQDVRLQPGQSEHVVPVVYRPTSQGLKRYEFRLVPWGQTSRSAQAPVRPGGLPPREDPYRLSVQVVDDRFEVLVLEDTWRWEFKFLRRVLEDDPSFRFTALLARGGGAFVQFASPGRRNNLTGFPQNEADLAGFDILILGDVNPRRWPHGLAAALNRLVREEGKSLVVVAGPNLARLAEVPELSTLLPVELTPESATPVSGPVDVRVSADGVDSAFFSAEGPADRNRPPLDQVYPPLRKRPAATVLLEASRRANAYGNLIVAAEHTVGRGRVLYVGTDALWKWQTLAPANASPTTPYSVFWQQALRALTPPRPGSPDLRLWLQPERSRYPVGRRIVIRAEVESPRPLARTQVQANVLLADGRRLPLAFDVDPSGQNTFRAEFEASRPGPHRITARVTTERGAAETETVVDVEDGQGGAEVDRANLASIAAANGGQVIDPARSETWPPGGESFRVSQVHTANLWDNFSLLVLLCVLLGVDWVLRLLKGFV
jgi:hypothetical protein